MPLGARIAGFAVVSCDIFDTAILRRLARPEDVHLVTGMRLASHGLITCPADAFQAYRVAAEHAVRRIVEARGDDEPGIAEVYEYLRECGIVTDSAAAAEIEFAAEVAVCGPNEAIQATLAGRAAGQRLVFVSDSILPGAWLARLLSACGYGEDCTVFSSADTRRNKHGGRQYAHVIDALGCAPQEIVHIGDNPVSDGKNARRAGIATVAVPAPTRPPERAEIAGQSPLLRLVHSHRRSALATPTDGEFGALHRYATMLAIGFSLFILAEARRRGIRDIFFLARDGWLPLAITRRLIAGTGEAFSLHYLEVSRRSSAATGIAAYLTQSGLTAEGPHLIVDVGWRASTQEALARITGAAIHGCYLGLLPDALRPGITLATTASYLFGFGHPAPVMEQILDGYVVLEVFFSAPHGSVQEYAVQDGRIAAVHATEAEPGASIRRAAFAAIEAGILAEFDTLDALLDGAWPATIDPQAALADLRPLLTTPSAAEVALVNRIPFIHGADDGENAVAVNRMPFHMFLTDPTAALRRAANTPWRAGWVRANLPWPFPPMTYATFRDRAERLLRRK